MSCSRMLEMAVAAEYVEKLLHDTDEVMLNGLLAADGSSPVAVLLAIRGLQEEQSWAEWQVGAAGSGIVVV